MEETSSCTAQLGVTSCPSGVFPQLTDPDDSEIILLAEDQVLRPLTSTGSDCRGKAVGAQTGFFTRFCTSGTLEDPKVGPHCIDGKEAISGGTMGNFLRVEFDLSPNSINVKCTGNDSVRVTFFGSADLDVTKLVQDSLRVQGVPVTSCDQKKKDLLCKVNSCDLGLALAAKRGNSRTVNVEVTGSLTEGLPIHGEETVETSPPPK